MSVAPYVPLTKALDGSKSKTPKQPTGFWELGEFRHLSEMGHEVSKKLRSKVFREKSKDLEKAVVYHSDPSGLMTTVNPKAKSKTPKGAIKPGLKPRIRKSYTYLTLRKAGQGEPSPAPQQDVPQASTPQAAQAKPLQPVGNPEVRRMANDYVKQAGVANHLPEQGYAPLLPEAQRKSVADEYQKSPHNPGDPDVQNAYAAFAHETKQQYEHALNNGMVFTPWGQHTDPYKTSDEMRDDVMHNKHLGFYQGGDMPQDHPLAQIDPDHNLNYNDMFRAVHDLYGHAKEGYEFGPRGEYNAFLSHKQMYSPTAQKAMRTETHGQNNWVNYGPHLRKPDGSFPKKGEPGWVHPAERPFAEQKASIMPDWVEGGR